MKTRLLGILGGLAFFSACAAVPPLAPRQGAPEAQVTPPPRTFTRSQITDFQTDLMLFIGEVPQLKPHFNADGFDPILRMRNHANNGQVPRGIVSGTWMWTVNLPNYPEDLWPLAFAQAKKLGWTHWFLHVARAEIGDGYHALYPVDAEYAAGYGARLNRAHAALVANGFIPVAAGVAPDGSSGTP